MDYIKHLESCFEKAQNLESKIDQGVRDMQGMTGQMTRHFYNNLLSIEDARYLEIGAWMGSSTCAAMCGNKADVVVIDDFSGFGGPKEAFLKNFAEYKGENNAEFIETDCFKMDLSRFTKKFNIYLFDGDHGEESQFKAVDYYLPAMDDTFILVVDDWNWPDPRNGTYRSIEKNKLEILWKKEIRLTSNDQYTSDQEEANQTFWNGIAVFILKKP